MDDAESTNETGVLVAGKSVSLGGGCFSPATARIFVSLSDTGLRDGISTSITFFIFTDASYSYTVESQLFRYPETSVKQDINSIFFKLPSVVMR